MWRWSQPTWRSCEVGGRGADLGEGGGFRQRGEECGVLRFEGGDPFGVGLDRRHEPGGLDLGLTAGLD